MRCGRLFLIPSVAITGTSLSGYLTHEGAGSTTVSRCHLHSNTMQEEGANREASTSSTGAAIPSSASTSATSPTDGTPDFIQSLLSRRRLLDRPIYEHFCSIFASSSSSPLTSSSASSSSTSFLAHPSVSLAVICTEELEKVETICSLHLTQQSQWDRLLVSNTAMQERLAQLSSWRCGLQSLLSYVSHHLAEQPSASSCASPEVAALHIFAEMAMLESASLVREMVDASLWPTAVPHVSCLATDEGVQEERETTATTEKETEGTPASASSTPIASSVPKGTPGKCIDYPYIEEFLEGRIPSLFLQPRTRTVPSIVEQVYAHILPLLSVPSRSGGTTRVGSPLFPSWMSSPKGTAKTGAEGGRTSPTSSTWSVSSKPRGGSLLSRMMGMHSGGDEGFRLHAPHILLQHTAEAVEEQTVSFLKWIDLQNASKPFFSSSTAATRPSQQELEKGMGQKMRSSCAARDVLWGSRLGMGLADIFASVAILHRGSAALLQLETQEATAATPSTSSERSGRSDGEGRGGRTLATTASRNALTASHLDTLYAQSFPFFSNQRVSRYMHEVTMADAVVQRMNTTAKRSSTSPTSAKSQDADESPIFLSIDGSATHPIVLASFEKK